MNSIVKSWTLFLLIAMMVSSCGTNETEIPEPTIEKETAMTPEKTPEVYARFTTNMGSFKIRLFRDKAPITVQNFIDLVEGKKEYIDPATGQMVKRPLFEGGRKIFRVIKGFMFQTGSPNDTNSYQAGFTIPGEIHPDLKFSKPGLVAMANTGSPDTGSMQFFVTFAPTSFLDGGYTIFGEVVEGMDTVQKIENVPTKFNPSEGAFSTPVDMPVIQEVVIE